VILVTGATGLLGSHVVVDYLRKGETVRALYRFEERKKIVRKLLDHYCAGEAAELFNRIDWFKGDVLNLSDLKEAFVGVERVVHCAALVSFQKRDFYKLWEINREGTANMVNTALDSEVKHFVHVSSTAAVGTDGQKPDGLKRESNHWNANEIASTYSYTKYSAEKEVWRGIEEGLNAVIVNPSVMFGPGSWNESSLTIFRTISNGFNYYSVGGNAFVDVRDVSKVILRLQNENAVNERYLITGHNVSFKELFDLMSFYMKRQAPGKKATPFLTYLAWIASGIKSFFTGTDATLTKDSIRSAMGTSRFSSEKLLQKYPGFEFTPLAETIQETIAGRMD
jgi:nucleoside-diphosphate-sugar epimerase